MAQAASHRPLEGIRVLELGELIAGPFIGTLLAEFGAEVIKVERPEGGDVLRQFGPLVNGSSVFWQANSRGKKWSSLTLRRRKEFPCCRTWFDAAM